MSDIIERIRMVAREAARKIALLRDEIRRLRDDNERLRKALGDSWWVEADNA